MTEADYWRECISCGADECGLTMTAEQLNHLAKCVENGRDTYGMAFYAPPASDCLSEIERAASNKLKNLQSDFDKYTQNAEAAVKKALRQYPDAQISIGEDGEVFHHSGRTERIQ